MGKQISVLKIIFLLAACTWAVIQLFPLAWMINNSFKESIMIIKSPLALAWPPTFQNYPEAWKGETTAVTLNIYFRNSLIIVPSAIALLVISATMAAYGVGRYVFRGKRLFVFILLGFVAIPMHSMIIPLYHLIKRMGLLNNYLGLILVYVALGIPFSVLILQAFFHSFPEELENAARVDGCSEFKIFLNIALPMSKGAVAAIAIVNFISFWNELFVAMVLLWNNAVRTLPVGIIGYKGQWGQARWGLLFTGLSIVTIPMLIFYIVFSKKITSGMTLGSLK